MKLLLASGIIIIELVSIIIITLIILILIIPSPSFLILFPSSRIPVDPHAQFNKQLIFFPFPPIKFLILDSFFQNQKFPSSNFSIGSHSEKLPPLTLPTNALDWSLNNKHAPNIPSHFSLARSSSNQQASKHLRNPSFLTNFPII